MKIFIVGSGNLASHLLPALCKAGHEIIGLHSRNISKARKLCSQNKVPFHAHLDQALPCDFVFLLVSDDAIEKISTSFLNWKNTVLVHCSGAADIDRIKFPKNKRAVFYPLQTFSTSQSILSFRNIPLIIESESKSVKEKLETLAHSLSDSVHFMNSKKRLSLHMAAVFINNFSNHMAVIAEEICSKNKTDYHLLKPLMIKTAENAFPNPSAAQTGPAKRNDKKTIEKHLQILNRILPEERKLYLHLTNNILNRNNKK